MSYVSDMQKDGLWIMLKANFTLPPEEDPEKPVKEQLLKSCALKKMATLFRRWRKELNHFVEKKDTRIHRKVGEDQRSLARICGPQDIGKE